MAFSRQFFCPARGIAALLVSSLSLLAVQPCAWAQTDDDRAGARVAATEGVKASNEKRWADAVDLFTRAESLVHSPVHILYLARAQDKLGHLVKARENYNRVIREHINADSPDAFRQAQASAQREVGGVEARLAAVTLKLGGVQGDVTVTMDGEKVAPALIGLPLPVDPGSHTFLAAGTDLKSDPVSITVAEGGKGSVSLLVKPAPGTVAPFSAPPAAAATVTPTAVAAINATPPPNTQAKSRPVESGVYVGLVATGAFVVGAGVSGALALSKHSDFNKANDGSDPSKADSLRSSGQTLNLVNDLCTAGAVVAAGVTAYVFFSRPELPAQQAGRWQLSPAVGPNVAALNLSGSF
jgi:hypothetical protein